MRAQQCLCRSSRYPESPCLFLEFHGSDSGVKEQAETFGEIAEEFGGGPFQWTTSPRSGRSCGRRAMTPTGPGWFASRREGPDDRCLRADFAACRMRPGNGGRHRRGRAVAPIVGHVGDGNFHVLVLIDMENQRRDRGGEAFVERLNQRAIAMEGTCTGEHGIGQGKMEFLGLEAGIALDYMKAIKQALDPLGILNPGKQVGAGRALARAD
jgi:D-lactate dehydrogenase (cytochrome)